MNDLRLHADAECPGLTWITLDRPEARNAYSDAMIIGLVDTLDALEVDSSVQVVAITGAGRAFSAGGDLKAMAAHSGMFEGDATALRSRYMRGIQQIPRRFARFTKPTIAAVNGAAVGAGLDLATMCDLRLTTPRAKFGSTFVKVGLIPGDGGAYLLARTIGFPRALELVMSGRMIDAEEAERIGLVHAIVDEATLVDATRERAQRWMSLPPIAVQLAKQAAYRSWDLPMDAALELAATYQGISQNTADHDEAVDAFLTKRSPEFRGK